MKLLLTIQFADIAFIALLALVFCVFAVGIYLLYRNEMVYRLRSKLNRMCSLYWQTHNDNPYKWSYDQLPPYDEMLYSLKPLKLETWLPEEVLERLQAKN